MTDQQLAVPRTAWTATEIMAMTFPEPKWAVPGLIAEGVTLLVGAPKIGKSWLALNLSTAITTGTKALGKVEVATGDVLYLALEDTPRRLQSRLTKVLAGVPANDRLTLAIHCEPLTAGGSERVSAWLTEHPDARLVVVDVFARVRGAAPQNLSTYDADYLAMTALKRIADRHQVPVVVVHHTRKQAAEDFLDTVSGTNGLAGAADAVLVLTRSRGKADAELHVTGRDIEEAEHALAFDTDSGTWTLLDGPASDYTLGDTRRRVLDHVRAHGSTSPKTLMLAMNMPEGTAKTTLWRMAKAGQLDTDGSGSYFLPATPATSATGCRGNGCTGCTGCTPDGEA